ncbi:MAG: hypothetical protein OER86_12735, partial [Phycisphaerae bacterium]|nr:hypothetical protein [Phycisphaerae bacterium]
GLVRGVLHEWFGDDSEGGADVGRGGEVISSVGWAPPLCLLSHLAVCALSAGRHIGRQWAVWVGRACWPCPLTLVPGQVDPLILRQSIFVDASDTARRLWAVDLAARCSGVAAVVADGRGLDMAATRRLQLAARAGGALLLAARSSHEQKQLSAAATRWRVCSVVSETFRPRWHLELLRCKLGRRSRTPDGSESWWLEWDGAENRVRIPADVLYRPGLPAMAGKAGAEVVRRIG